MTKTQSIKIKDRVKVIPAVKEQWTNDLKKWIKGRKGIVANVRKDIFGDMQYSIKFKNIFHGSSTWICQEKDIRLLKQKT